MKGVMKILLIVKNFDVGGTEVNVCQLANGLSARGHKVHVASKNGRQVELLDAGVIHHEFNFSELRFVLNAFKLCRLVKEHEIMIVHGNQRMAISLAAIVANRSNVPSVGTVHGKFKQDIRSGFIRKLLDQIIVVAPNRINGVKGGACLKSKTKVIYNSIPLPDIKSCDRNGEKMRLVCVSRIDRKHGSFLEQLITEVMPTILNEFEQVELQILGDGSHFGYLSDLLAGLDDERLQGSVTLMGYQSDPIEIMRDAGLVFGVGRVAIEALMVNTPVISANSLFCGGLVTMDNYESMKYDNFVSRNAEAFTGEVLISHLSHFLEISEEVQSDHFELCERARADFSSSKMLDETLSVYSLLLEGG